ncbi:hydrolase [Hymenobacter sp. 15J16-1T3B]|uniref:hydrolase n=1 Tax=Hymenobacter sp. 15J16-1T3B TaxID=2886941 RepID=UPI001D129855|nr:hydrolase [Hymenobacter sp. 15J16-1T3B]MCC3156163.1 hydrolase [Hymenobacter sp. 15J16-1T3B]
MGCPLLVLAFGCAKTDAPPPQGTLLPVVASHDVSNTGFPEGFESGTKTAYSVGTVTLGSGSWTLDDALLGTTTSDPKTGAQSARVRNAGKLTMNFNATGGAGTVTISHATYGTDGASTWELWKSVDSGASYTKVGSTVTTSSATLSTATFTVNQSGSVRFEIRKTDGSANRVNFDNLDIQTYSGGGSTGGTAKKFLIDAGHAETAGNADWVMDVDAGVVARYPTPAASGITSSTSETYWTGALSSWGVSLVKLGHSVEHLPAGVPITYGTTGAQDLQNYNVFIIDEPNTLFTAAEKTALVRFVQNGGGLFMISDHDVSDRNSDGYDSPAIWNDLMSNNSVQSNPFGFSIDLNNIVETSSNVLASSTNPILNGPQGAVTQIKYSNGATITKTSGSAAVPLVWRSTSAQGNTNIMCASSTYGTGRVVVIGDSSPADDGTGSPGNTVYPGWTELASHARFHLNASLWLAKVTN